MSAPKVDVLAAERDARTIYDIACIREQSEAASREDVEFKAITLRNYQFCIAVAELIEADKEYDAARQDFFNVSQKMGEAGGRAACEKAYAREKRAMQRRAEALARIGGAA